MAKRGGAAARATMDRALAERLPERQAVIGGGASQQLASKYTPELMAEIMERVASGETMTEVCKGAGMPSATQVRRWVMGHPELRDAWFTAKQLKASAIFDEALAIARDMRAGGLSTPDVSALRVVLEHLRWAAGKLAPAEFGDKQPAVPAMAIQINTTLDLGGTNRSVQEGELSVYKVEIPLPGAVIDNEPVLDVKVPRKRGQITKNEEETDGPSPGTDV